MSPRTTSAVGVVVVSYRSDGVLSDLVASLAAYEAGCRIVVVDNGTPEGPPTVSDLAPSAHVVSLRDNIGYGRACNVGAESLMADGIEYLAFLNPDVRLTGPSLTQLVKHLAQRPRAGIATGPVQDGLGRRVPSAWGRTSALRAAWFAAGRSAPRLRRIAGRFLASGPLQSSASIVRQELRVTGHVLGGAMVIRRRCWQELAGFDPSFFLYWEDADLCARARALGWEIWMLPCAPFVHGQGRSSRDVAEQERWQWYVEGATIFAQRHLGWLRRGALIAALRIGRRLRRSADAGHATRARANIDT